MSVLTSILGAIGSKAGEQVSGIIDGLTTSDSEKSTAKAQLTEIVTNSLNEVTKAQADVLKTELTGNFLQRSWRPIVMLTFTAIIVVGAFRTIPFLDSSSPFWNLLELGLGGYVVGRSVEKVADTVTKNIDIPFLKKKDRS